MKNTVFKYFKFGKRVNLLALILLNANCFLHNFSESLFFNRSLSDLIFVFLFSFLFISFHSFPLSWLSSSFIHLWHVHVCNIHRVCFNDFSMNLIAVKTGRAQTSNDINGEPIKKKRREGKMKLYG